MNDINLGQAKETMQNYDKIHSSVSLLQYFLHEFSENLIYINSKEKEFDG